MHELDIERQKNEMLIKKLRETNKIVKSYELSQTPGEWIKLSSILRHFLISSVSP